MVTNVRQIGAGGDNVDSEDTKSTFTAAAGGGTTNQDLQPSSGDVWQISVFAAITAGGAADTLKIQMLTDTADETDLDSGDDNTPVSVNNVVISNDCYIRIECTTGVAGGNRTITYWYQAFKV